MGVRFLFSIQSPYQFYRLKLTRSKIHPSSGLLSLRLLKARALREPEARKSGK